MSRSASSLMGSVEVARWRAWRLVCSKQSCMARSDQPSQNHHSDQQPHRQAESLIPHDHPSSIEVLYFAQFIAASMAPAEVPRAGVCMEDPCAQEKTFHPFGSRLLGNTGHLPHLRWYGLQYFLNELNGRLLTPVWTTWTY